MWRCLRKAVGGSWCHDNLPGMFAEVLRSHGATVRLSLWVTIGVLLWILWNVRTKLVIEHVIPLRATDAISNCVVFYSYGDRLVDTMTDSPST